MKEKHVSDHPGKDRLWLWFGSGRASFLTIPRVLMHEMPDDWQMRMAMLMEEYDDTFTNWPEDIGTRVQITSNDKLTSIHGWLKDYRHPDTNQIQKLKNNP